MKHNRVCSGFTLEKGFTLIELAVVLVIVGILLGGFIGTFAARVDTTRVHNTEKEMEEIKQVLMAYAFTQTPPHLPCPDVDDPPDGIENRSTVTPFQCKLSPTGKMGVVPWLTLGLAYDDSWGMRYSYWAGVNYSKGTGFNLSTDNSGLATIETRVGNTKENMVINAVAVILSHGKNGYGGIDSNDNTRAFPAAGTFVDEQGNIDVDTDSDFMSRPPTDQQAATVGGEFDDIITWINSYELKAKMVETGVLP